MIVSCEEVIHLFTFGWEKKRKKNFWRLFSTSFMRLSFQRLTRSISMKIIILIENRVEFYSIRSTVVFHFGMKKIAKYWNEIIRHLYNIEKPCFKRKKCSFDGASWFMTFDDLYYNYLLTANIVWQIGLSKIHKIVGGKKSKTLKLT